MKYGKKMSKLEKREFNRAKIESSLRGKGLHIFRNRTNGELFLRKMSADGKKSVQPGQTWTGDDFFMKMVTEEHTALLVETIRTEDEETPMETTEKLILDQPDSETPHGKVEQVMVSPTAVKLNEEPQAEEGNKVADILLVDDSLEGVEIFMD
jgi:hypothetical protein